MRSTGTAAANRAGPVDIAGCGALGSRPATILPDWHRARADREGYQSPHGAAQASRLYSQSGGVARRLDDGRRRLGALHVDCAARAALTRLSARNLVVLAVATFASALCILVVVPDTPAHSRITGWQYQWAGVKRVFGSARFWWVAPLCAVATGSFMAIQGLWSVPWLMEGDGYSRMVAADHLLVLGIVILGGYLGLSFFATTLSGRRRRAPPACGGFGLNILMLAC